MTSDSQLMYSRDVDSMEENENAKRRCCRTVGKRL